MSTTPAITVSALSNAAAKYDKDFKTMPHILLLPSLMELRVRLLNVPDKHILIEKLRKGGITQPYTKGQDIVYSTIGEMRERALTTDTSFAAIKDHIKNYKGINVLYDPTKDAMINSQKKHPLEVQIITDQIKTVGEDILDALFPATRNTDDKSPLGMINGFDTLITNAIASGEISVAEKNLVNSGAFAAPASETDTQAWDRLVAWIRSKSPKFAINGISVLRLPIKIYSYCSDALANKLRYKDVEFADFVRHLQDKANLPNLIVIKHYTLGDGDRISLMVDGNLDLGMNVIGDEQFVQVRNPWEDPNLVQFWLQFDAGARVNSMHSYKFMVNEGTPVANSLSGDYTDSGSSGTSV